MGNTGDDRGFPTAIIVGGDNTIDVDPIDVVIPISFFDVDGDESDKEDFEDKSYEEVNKVGKDKEDGSFMFVI
ncbi:hypothetical protein AMTR_s00038p00054470 [Amborella trichopoda]|uniref:Uncharacterized protein n=1 Tax=Amborella trichopoda TaxID=13333 RepID=U5CWL2_AMBTC|nr:hypothetical protein AMTR_s00038p00054470 [Amborella trichopoda]